MKRRSWCLRRMVEWEERGEGDWISRSWPGRLWWIGGGEDAVGLELRREGKRSVLRTGPGTSEELAEEEGGGGPERESCVRRHRWERVKVVVRFECCERHCQAADG